MPAFLFPFVSVLLLYLASPGPGFSFLAWVALVPLLIFCLRSSPGKAALLGLIVGILYHLLLVYWVTISMETYGGLQPLVAWPALVLLALYMALYFTVFCFVISKTKDKVPFLWLAPMLWVSLDYCRGFLLTGFPWMDLGYTQYKYSLLIQAADLTGHHGVTFILVLANALLAHFFMGRHWFKHHKIQAAAALILVALFFSYSIARFYQVSTSLQTSKSLNVAVVQANIDQALKWQDDHKKISLERHLKLTNQARKENNADLVIWPETALAFYPTHDPLMAYVEKKTVLSASFHLLTGAPYAVRGEQEYDYYNSAMLLSPQRAPAIYFKQHLVPFGEYIPMRTILPIPKPIVESMGDFSAGTTSTPLDMGRAQIGVLICIEAIYPDLARRATAQGATLLANITNDAWFGASSAPVQHLAMAIFRTIENKRSMARAANTGISALILPTGEILRQTGLFQAGFLSARLPLLTTTTFFTRAGFLFPLLCLAGVLLLLAIFWKKRGHQAK
ncbi:MAG: apolipoprotein N-acyltransferase [Proteobacteria bacterium]|nr:apolipoprotein N-acyltransferase [Pseudomonadota bacterium]MBU1639314.1 apolipoprotein N-acyltransferase [Pseudomonadota bacterium]